MPNLVGIGNSQVPTNAMLGGLAYQDPAHANLTSVEIENIAAIKAKTVDTAVDVFVYDTRKDSDGGAWRKRTQNTSWYNEGASSTRGARKEFPAVAVIVATTDTYTIYDGDDPNMSMWMVFESDGSSGARVARSGTDAITMLNGLMCAVRSGSQRAAGFASFIDDTTYQISNSGKYEEIGGRDGLVNRNVTGGWGSLDSSYAVTGNGTMYDVAMIVLPNARIDVYTGLPIPTIAIATNGGVSVIKDDGTVVDITSGTIIHHEPRSVDFLGTRLLWTEGNNYDLQDRAFLNAEVPSADTVLPHTGALPSGYIGYGIGSGAATVFNNFSLLLPLNNELSSPARERKFCIDGPDNTIVLGCKHAVNGGLELIHQNINSPSDGMVATATTSYNTGWMHGDCKLAVLCDTDDTDITGDNRVTNGSFSNGTAGWSANNASLSVTDFVLKVDDSSNAGLDSQAYRSVTGLTIGKVYYVGVRHKSSSQHRLWIDTGSGPLSSGNVITHTYTSSYATSYRNDYYSFTATTTSVTIALQVDGAGIAYYNWCYINEGRQLDRCAGNTTYGDKNHLQVSNAITKEPVATGADLVSYSGYTYNNYLHTYTTAPGSGDFSVTAWIKPGTNGSGTGNYLHLFQLSTPTTGGQSRSTGFTLKMATNGSGGYSPYFYNADGGTNHGTYDTSNRIPLGAWSQLIGMRRGGTAYIYLNGELLKAGNSWSTDLTDTYVGIFRAPGFTGENGGDAKVALLRYSTTAPTAEQVKKMYNDEKPLFQENAKCTLYGSSSAVTAIAYDDSNDIVNVGTSSGRSDFVGLRRINNTTTAVTTAISASNGLIAEQ